MEFRPTRSHYFVGFYQFQPTRSQYSHVCTLQEFSGDPKYTVHSTHTDLDALFTDLKFVYSNFGVSDLLAFTWKNVYQPLN